MTKKKFIKKCMGMGISRNIARLHAWHVGYCHRQSAKEKKTTRWTYERKYNLARMMGMLS